MWRNLIKVLAAGLLLAIIFILGTNLLVPRNTANADAVETANKLAATGNSAKSIEIYEQLISQGVNDSVVFYNLGNVYYGIGDIGRAVANYNRAAKLDPRDPDIKTNLELARSQITEPYVENDSGLAGLMSGITDGWLSLNETALIVLALWFLASLMMLGWRSIEQDDLRSGFKYAFVVAILLLFLTGISLIGRVYSEQFEPEGVVVVPTIAVSSEPHDGFATDLALSSGAEIRVSETMGHWARISASGDSKDSWIPLETVEMLTAISPAMSLTSS